MNVTVVGSGNGGLTTAFDFALHGHTVRLFDTPHFPHQAAEVATAGDQRPALGIPPSRLLRAPRPRRPSVLTEDVVAVLSEALSNVARHADASSVNVKVDLTDGVLTSR